MRGPTCRCTGGGGAGGAGAPWVRPHLGGAAPRPPCSGGLPAGPWLRLCGFGVQLYQVGRHFPSSTLRKMVLCFSGLRLLMCFPMYSMCMS
jgi:hypothetical protein